MKTFQEFSSYTELQWTPNGWRSKLVSVQLQRAINDTRKWIRVLSSKTIGHLKKKKKIICFINTNTRLALFFVFVTSRNTLKRSRLRGLCHCSSVLHLPHWLAYVKRDLFNVITRITEQSKANICVYKAYKKKKLMIDRFTRWDPYFRPLENSWNVFIKNLTFFSTEERNT